MTHGIKSFAQDLAKHGRYGDTMVAHINPQEATLLKAMGGSGTINPTTGLPEFFGLGSITKPFTQAVKSVQQTVGSLNPLNPGSSISKTISGTPIIGPVNDAINNLGTQVFQPLEKAVVQPASAGLASVDKAVGKVVPGGWGTLGMVAASMIPGMQPLAMAGLGAINGSGVLHKGRGFNLQGAIMGGALAYGMANLAQGLQTAGSSIPAADITAANAAPDAIQALNASQGWTGPTAEALTQGATQAAGQTANNFAYTPSGEMVPSNVSADITGASSPVVPPTPTPTPVPSGLEQFATKYGENVAAAGRGIANLSGLGETTSEAARAAFTGTGATLQNTALPIVVGGMGLADLEAQAQYLKDQQAAGTISSQEYTTQMAAIDAAREKANQSMNQNPYMFGNNTTTNPKDAMNQNPYMFAAGGNVQANPPDDQTGMMNQSPMTNFGQPGIMSMVDRTVPQQMFSGGGMPEYSEGGEPKARKERELFDMLDASFRAAPAGQNVEGMGFMTPPPSVSGRLGANLDALGGNIRAGVSGNAMLTPDKKIITRPEMMDVGYKGQVGPGTLDLNLQRAIQAQAGRNKDYAIAANYSMPFSEGGMAAGRFLSGGGDGLSDGIPAIIGDKQPAKLADGEFVVSSDVVSGLGGGSSKAGAKKLYAMMDRVRKQAHGTKKQIRPVSTKALPA